MKNIFKYFRTVITCILLLLITIFPVEKVNAENYINKSNARQFNLSEIEQHIDKCMSGGGIPGGAVAIVSKERTYTFFYGYEDRKNNVKVDKDTKFELGSNSKAFTGYAILQLVNENKINLDDTIQKYLPKLELFYEGQQVFPTIENLLHHTSGIPYSTIADFKIDSRSNALETAIEQLDGISLTSRPGTKFEYATMNYDVLGFLIEKISGMSYENYMRSNVFLKLDLLDTWSISDAESKENMSKGYMWNWGRQREYETPLYAGNIPAGYLISDIEDVAEWLKLQMFLKELDEVDKCIINQSHEANRRVSPDGTASYAIGWESYQNGGGDYRHEGVNQYFSSYMRFHPEEQIGIAVLCNTNSSYTQAIGDGIYQIINGKAGDVPRTGDLNKRIDNLSILFIIFSILIVLIIAYSFFIYIKKGMLRLKKQEGSGRMIIILSIMLVLILVGIYMIPKCFGDGVTWKFVQEWLPSSLMLSIKICISTLVLLFLYLMTISLIRGETKGTVVSVIFLSIFSGIGNAIIIFVINYSIGLDNRERLNIILYLVIGIFMYICGQKVVRNELISLSNELICNKRNLLVNRYLNSSYEKIEQIGFERFHTTLSNDTEVVSNFVNVLVSSATSFVTILCCFIYLYILNKYALLLAVGVVLFISSIYFAFGQYANKLNESARNLQNVFIGFVNDLLYGIKDLLMCNKKNHEFELDMKNVSEAYRDKRVEGANIYANLFILGELLFTLAIAVVAFGFPFIIQNMGSVELSGYIFVLLYLTGPINTLLDGIPNILSINISRKRIRCMLEELGQVQKRFLKIQINKKVISLELCDVEFTYGNDSENEFKIGPINTTIESGEIIFITGGNGSGKSTFAKLITGLYQPSNGTIKLNGTKIQEKQLSEYYSVVFSDFHLFTRLYGIDCVNKFAEIKKYLHMLQLEDKVKVVDGKFTTIDLSTGQKKRLALLVSLLEDKQIYLFDEWAADQDPTFRKYFYEEILPDLKYQGKCVIAITHDDRYFNLADRHFKFEFGNMFEVL